MSLKIAISSYTGYGFYFALRLLSEGHKVNLYTTKPDYADILKGIVPTPRIVAGRSVFPDYSKYDLSLFDLTGRQRQAEFSNYHCPTIGDGVFNCQAEDDRMFGLQIMERAGIKVPPYERFVDTSSAVAFIRKNNKRYVYKPDGGQENDTDTTYVSANAEDMLGNLDKLFIKTNGSPFVLQEFIKGTEVSVEGWFNGDEFYLVNVTLEEKKFMNDNKGPNTGCAGNLVFYLRESAALYKQGLEKMRGILRTIGYRGMIDLNTIVTENDIYGLEWTPRFGYDASATLFNMYGGNFGNMLYSIATGQVPEQSWRGEFAAATRISIPPYPSEIKGKHPAGVPVKGIEPEHYLNTYMYDVMLEKKELVTAGHSGFLLCPLSYGDSIQGVWEEQKARIEGYKIPNAQYRTDLDKTTKRRYYELSNMGLL